MEKLLGKPLKFAIAYIICLNQTEAARQAGYAGDDATLCVQGNRLLKNANVLAYIDEHLKAFAMPANEVLVQLSDIARADLADALNPAGGIDPLEAKRRGKSHLIKKFKTKTTTMEDREIYETEIEMHDRLDALKTLAKYHNLVNNTQITIVTWQDRAVQDIRDGKIVFEDLAREFDYDLATELFTRAGVPISSG